LFFTLPTFLLTLKSFYLVGGEGAQQVDGRLLCLLAVEPEVAKAGLVSLGNGICPRSPLLEQVDYFRLAGDTPTIELQGGNDS
jgi:hypothetical protein